MAKVTIDKIFKAINREEPKYTTVNCGEDENAISFQVRNRLSLMERAEMVESIADAVFEEDDNGKTTYRPAFTEIAIGYYVLSYFTDISLNGKIEKTWKLIDETHIIDAVKSAGNIGEYIEKIIDEARELIEFKKQKLYSTSKLDELIGKGIDVITSIKSKTDAMSIEQILGFVNENAPEFSESLKKMLGDELAINEDV